MRHDLLWLEKGSDAAGREAIGLFENLGEVVGVVEAGLFGGLLYTGLLILHQQEGSFHPFPVQDLSRCGFELGAEELVQMLRRDVKRLCQGVAVEGFATVLLDMLHGPGKALVRMRRFG